MTMVFKILSKEQWASACAVGEFAGAEIDLVDGYIHFSAAQQVAETAAKHFAKRSDLLLLSVECRPFGDAMKWEPSRGGDLFPHLYGTLPIDSVARVDEMQLDEQGVHVLPDHVAD